MKLSKILNWLDKRYNPERIATERFLRERICKLMEENERLQIELLMWESRG